jgi:hypothetical protein
MKSSACERAADATHLSLIGGKFKIDKIDLFLRMYSKNYKTIGAHLVEKVSYPSKWYIDLDHQLPGFVEGKLINILVATRENCIVCVPSERDAAHIIFHDIVVNSPDEAIQKTSKLFTDFDKSVYRSGLRMLGSRKKANIGREYYPYAYVRNGNVVYSESPGQLTHADLLLATIHTNLPPIRIACHPRSINVATTTDFGFIHPNYKNVSVSQIKPMKGFIQVLVKSRFCMNVDREHSSNHVYFMIRETSPMTVHVQCFNDCNCKGYKSASHRMPVVLFYNIKNKLK